MGCDWGTWEELILGGAVLRHGTKNWNVVADELKARTVYPFAFTPQVCRSKYEDLQKRYSGSKAWFDELKKRRVAALKQELARSADSIGSLESKIKTLEAQNQNSIQVKVTSQAGSPVPLLNSNSSESFSKNTSKNEHSAAASFTEDTRESRSWCERQNQANEQEKNPESIVSSEQKNDSNVKEVPEAGYGKAVTIRKRRGQRKRKNCNLAVAEVSVGESENLGSSTVASVSKDRSTSDWVTRIRDCGTNIGSSRVIRKDNNLMDIYESIAETEPAGVFKHRMDSQKRARYRKIIRRHLDMGTIRSRIFSRVIQSPKELFRDLLLLANNALVFYSKRTREFKSAFSLRQLVMKEYKQYCRGSTYEVTSAFIPCNPPVKPRSARPRPRPHPIPCKDNVPVKEAILPEKEAIPCKDNVPVKEEKVSVVVNVPAPLEEAKKPSDSDPLVAMRSTAKAKKGLKRPARVNVPVKEEKLSVAENIPAPLEEEKKPSDSDPLHSTTNAKKGLKRPAKVNVPVKEEKLSVAENVPAPLEEAKKPSDSDPLVAMHSTAKAKKGLKRPARNNVPVKEEKLSVAENAPAPLQEVKKPSDSDPRAALQSTAKAKKGLKRPAKAKSEAVEKRSRNSPVKPRKRARK